jgi:diguanylate cyclase (GGDEF)-like protein
VAASVVLGVPASHIVTHTWIFAGMSAISVAVVRFLVKEQQRQRTAANGLAALARETAAARTVDEGIGRCAVTIRELTGALSVRMLPADATADLPETHTTLMAGRDRTGRVALCLEDVRSSNALPAIIDLLSQLCERDRQLYELEQLARTDPLTGVGNRPRLEDLLRTDTREIKLTAVMLDLDHFKTYNDLHGHLAGDQLLRSFAQLIDTQLRHPDVVVRWGGEEFCLLIHGAPGDAEVIVDRLRRAWDEHESTVTFSAGVAAAGDDDTNMLDRADAALYEAKSAGRNRTILGA